MLIPLLSAVLGMRSPQPAQADSTRISPKRNTVSAASVADVFQGATADTIKILYDLSAKTGDDGKTYIPVDMGYGVAWADRNVGAADANATGSYFRWGDSDASHYTIGQTYLDWTTRCSANNDFASQYDMAKSNMGNRWRMPSKSDYTDLITYSTITDNNRFTNRTDNSKYILFPATGNYYGTTQYDAAYQYYWTKTYGGTKNDKSYVYCLVRTGNNTYKSAYTDIEGRNIPPHWGIACRAIYVPPFTPCTLTVSVNGQLYRYLCEPGQEVTVTAHATAENHVFDRWTEDGNTRATRTFTVTDDMTYTATFKEKPAEKHIILDENADNAHYDEFAADYDGVTVTSATLNRTFSAGRWSTMTLPFEVSRGMMSSNGLWGCVYEFRHATGNASTTVTLYFTRATRMEAGKCYIINPSESLAKRSCFLFGNVTVNLNKDKGEALNSVTAYNSLDGYNDGTGSIELVGTLRNGMLSESAGNNTYMGLKGNRIYYPNTSTGSTIHAYRGVFRSTTPMNISRIRIVVEDEEMTELEVADDEIQNSPETRKLIRDGKLYIRCNGVTYDATGQRIKDN